MLITFEGPEGAGKSTAIRAVADHLRTLDLDVVVTREPGAGEFGKRIRAILLEGDDVGMKSELMLFLADRANHVDTLIRPSLERGQVVLCDRFTDSTLVYQGYARGLDIDSIKQFNTFATGGLSPDLTILFDLEPEIGLARIESGDRLDREPLEFHRRVRDGFLAEAELQPERWRVIDARQTAEQVFQQVAALITERISSHSPS